jgi:hypothetical protein
MKMKPMAVLAVAMLGGCGGLNLTGPNYYVPPPRVTTGADYRPLVDNAGSGYEEDLSACQQHARSEASPGDGAVAGAITGALVGVALNAVAGGGHGLGYSSLGAAAGGVGGMTNAGNAQQQVVINCMRGRGYSVLR